MEKSTRRAPAHNRAGSQWINQLGKPRAEKDGRPLGEIRANEAALQRRVAVGRKFKANNARRLEGSTKPRGNKMTVTTQNRVRTALRTSLVYNFLRPFSTELTLHLPSRCAPTEPKTGNIGLI